MSPATPVVETENPLGGDDEFPLIALFDDLRAAGLPLGTDDYLRFLQALQLGEGIADRGALLRLCQILWASSREEARVIRRLFERAEVTSTGATTPSVSVSAPSPDAGRETPADEAQPMPSKPPTSADARVEVPADDAKAVAGARRALQVAIAALGHAPPDSHGALFRHVVLDEYLPVSTRQMRQAWRRLRRMERRGPRTEPDLHATIAKMAEDGFFSSPVLVARRVNVERLLLLIDRQGSMTPFQVLAREMIETARRGSRLAAVEVYYFHNCPVDYLSSGTALGRDVSLDQTLARMPSSSTGAVVFSDAGAARGGNSTERVNKTRGFLQRVRAHLDRVVWLNPVPRDRWSHTTAAAIAEMVPMFEATRTDLEAALRVLRGRRPYLRGER